MAKSFNERLVLLRKSLGNQNATINELWRIAMHHAKPATLGGYDDPGYLRQLVLALMEGNRTKTASRVEKASLAFGPLVRSGKPPVLTLKKGRITDNWLVIPDELDVTTYEPEPKAKVEKQLDVLNELARLLKKAEEAGVPVKNPQLLDKVRDLLAGHVGGG